MHPLIVCSLSLSTSSVLRQLFQQEKACESTHYFFILCFRSFALAWICVVLCFIHTWVWLLKAQDMPPVGERLRRRRSAKVARHRNSSVRNQEHSNMLNSKAWNWSSPLRGSVQVTNRTPLGSLSRTAPLTMRITARARFLNSCVERVLFLRVPHPNLPMQTAGVPSNFGSCGTPEVYTVPQWYMQLEQQILRADRQSCSRNLWLRPIRDVCKPKTRGQEGRAFLSPEEIGWAVSLV